MLRVAVAAAGDLLLDSIQTCLQQGSGIESKVIHNTTELLSTAQNGSFDALILDDQFDPTLWIGNLIITLKKAAPELFIIVVGTFSDGALIYELLDLGISGYLYRGDELRPLFEASLKSACANKPYLSPTASSEYTLSMQTGRSLDWHLDHDSRLVLDLLAQGLNVNEMVHYLKMKRRRVYHLLEKLRNRFNVATNEAVILHATQQGYLSTRKD